MKYVEIEEEIMKYEKIWRFNTKALIDVKNSMSKKHAAAQYTIHR